MIHKDFVDYLPKKFRGTRNLYEEWSQNFFGHEKVYHENLILGYPLFSPVSLMSDWQTDVSRTITMMDRFYSVAHGLLLGINGTRVLGDEQLAFLTDEAVVGMDCFC